MPEPRPTVAIVTGAGRGIGAATARRLSDDGMHVAVLDVDERAARYTADAIVVHGGVAVAVGVDVSDGTGVIDAVARAAQELGPPTVLVNNAGITRDDLIFRMTDRDWDAVLGVHLRGAFLMSRAVQDHMVRAEWGRIVNLSSTSALGNRGQANYSAATAGLQGFTRTLAIELGRFGVTANCVAPGFVAGDMTRATAQRLGVGRQEYLRDRAAAVPVRRAGRVDDVAQAVSFFADRRSGFVSGQVLHVAGGPRC